MTHSRFESIIRYFSRPALHTLTELVVQQYSSHKNAVRCNSTLKEKSLATNFTDLTSFSPQIFPESLQMLEMFYNYI